MAKFTKGHKKVGGKVKGTPNVLTQQIKTVKETVLAAFNELQQDPKANIIAWGKQNPAAFYNVAAKLIPTEVSAKVEVTKPIIIDWGNDTKENT